MFHSLGHLHKRSYALRGSALVVAVISLVAMGITAANASARPRALANIIIGDGAATVNNAPLWIGQSNGIFANNGLNVKIVSLGNAAGETTALASGSVQAAAQVAETVISADEAGAQIESIGANEIGIGATALVVNKTYAAEHGITVGLPTKTILQKLEGSIQGTSSTTTSGDADALFSSYGISPSTITQVSISGLAAVASELNLGKINFYIASDPTPLQTQAEGYGEIVVTSKNAPIWAQKQLLLVDAVNTNYANANPGLMREMMHALSQANAFVHNHAQKSLPVLEQNLTGFTPAQLLRSLLNDDFPVSPKQNESLWRSTVNFGVKSLQLPHGTTVTENVQWTNKFD